LPRGTRKGFSGIERLAQLKLDRLEAAASLQDLAGLPGNRFEALKGDRQGQFSIPASTINGGSALDGPAVRKDHRT
jgi:plasmid maintenance system killer protein